MGVVERTLGLATAKHVPFHAVVELTRRCNLKCVHCYAAPEEGRPELTPEELRGVLQDLRAMGTLFVSFTGGDPAMNPDFLPLVRAASDLHFSLQIFTNGLRMDAETADALAGANVFHVQVSLYGATAATHDGVTRVGGSFERTVAAAARLRERGVYVIFKYIAMNLNIHEAGAAVEMAGRLAIPIKFDALITPRDNLARDTVALRADADAVRDLYRRHMRSFFTPARPRANGGDFSCAAGKTLMGINAYGDVYPCVKLPIPAGNVRQTPLREIWERSPFMNEVRAFPRMDRMHGCPECTFRSTCSRCPGNAYTETGDLYGPAPSSCREAVIWRSIVDAEKGRDAPADLPPGLAEASHDHLPGWTAQDVIEAADIGCAGAKG